MSQSRKELQTDWLFDPKSEQSTEQQAGIYVRACLDDILTHLDATLADLLHLNYNFYLWEGSPEFTQHQIDDKRSFFVVSEKLAQYLLGGVRSSAEDFEFAKLICRLNIFEGKPLPYSLRCFASSLIAGDLAAPKTYGHYPDRFFVKALAYLAIETAQEMFGLRATRNIASKTVSAADVVVAAFADRGHAMSFRLVCDLHNHRKYNAFRVKAEEFRELALDRTWKAVQDRLRPQSGMVQNQSV